MTVAIDTNIPPAVEQNANVRNAVTQTLAHLGEKGWTRPDIRKALAQLGNELTDSAVYRAQRDRVHTREVPVWKEFFAAVDAGTVAPSQKARKLNAKDIVDRATEAAKVLASLGERPNAQAMREALAQIAELLPTPPVDEDEDEAEAVNTEPTEADADQQDA